MDTPPKTYMNILFLTEKEIIKTILFVGKYNI